MIWSCKCFWFKRVCGVFHHACIGTAKILPSISHRILSTHSSLASEHTLCSIKYRHSSCISANGRTNWAVAVLVYYCLIPEEMCSSQDSFTFLHILWNDYLPPAIIPSYGSDGKESACSGGDLGSVPRSGRSPGERKSYPFQYSCLRNSMDREAWWATVHGGHKELNTAERLTHTYIDIAIDNNDQ